MMVSIDPDGGIREQIPLAPLAPPQRSGAHGGMTILDGHGGALALDLATIEPDMLSDACQRLLTGDVPHGACVIKVCFGDHCYVLSRRGSQHGSDILAITKLFDPGEHVALDLDLAWIVMGLLDSANKRRTTVQSSI